MDKYLDGRIKAYAYLFTDSNPPVPAEYARYFEKHGVLLPGYVIENSNAGNEKPSAPVEKPSVLQTLAKSESKTTSVTDASKHKTKGTER
jgi:hypothetical protein